jgi:hypothetical protein
MNTAIQILTLVWSFIISFFLIQSAVALIAACTSNMLIIWVTVAVAELVSMFVNAIVVERLVYFTLYAVLWTTLQFTKMYITLRDTTVEMTTTVKKWAFWTFSTQAQFTPRTLDGDFEIKVARMMLA